MLALDRDAIWHPYSALRSAQPAYLLKSAHGVRLHLTDGRVLIDGMASWWCVIHGYNHPALNQAVREQLDAMAHVMFGGLTHMPALELTRLLLELTPSPLQTVFYSDSGSVAVEVAMKMALQYWQGRGEPQRQRMLSLSGGYHGDTFGAMSVCDPVNGMHVLFRQSLAQQYSVARPGCRFGADCAEADIAPLAQMLQQHGPEIAALIMEPIVQGAGGMWFYSADYLRQARALCDEYDVLLILDEIATGFGRTGRMFACDHAGVSPDILCLGKALTGGYLSLGATLGTRRVASGIADSASGAFMHGPTFMANPLACAVARRSVALLLDSPWQDAVARIERGLRRGLEPCRELPGVCEVRVLGAIGVVELHAPVDVDRLQPEFVALGVWLRPFGRLVYLMPPYVISDADLDVLCAAVVQVLRRQHD